MASITLVSADVVRIVTLALDASSLRQRALAANIANAGNAAYQRQAVSFEARLRELASRSELAEAGTASLQPRLVNDDTPAALDQDVTALAANALHFQALLKSLNAELELMSLAANDGRR